jgi:hypothetical protein
VLPPGTAKDRVNILEEALRKAFNDPDFLRHYEKIVGEEAGPIMADELTKAIHDTPRDAEVIDLFKHFSGAAPLPPR